jgi:hypothetical protein
LPWKTAVVAHVRSHLPGGDRAWRCRKIENHDAILQFEKWQKNRNEERYEIEGAWDN